MKIGIVILIATFFANQIYSQSNLVSDSLLLETCKSIITSNQSNDSLKIDEAFRMHLSPVFSNLDDSTGLKVYRYLNVRLQKFCPEYKKYLDTKNPPKDDWISLETNPVSKMNKTACRQFLSHKKYYYFDQGGDTIKLNLKDNFWIDQFKDGTYSKLRFKWTSDSEFEISFVESTNPVRQSLSKLGEKYSYKLIEQYPNYYLVFLNMPELKVLGTFRIYYQQ